jgi:vacuolar iron transporter family protein
MNNNKSILSSYLREIVYGGTDGIITTFAVVAGFSGANLGNNSLELSIATVLLFGLANLFADASSMGLGNYLSIRSEKDVSNKYLKQINNYINQDTDSAFANSLEILKTKGFDHKSAHDIVTSYKTNKPFWAEFLMNYKLNIPNSEKVNPVITGIITFLSFMFFGVIPLIPYFFIDQVNINFIGSVFFSLSALILLGIIRWKVSEEAIRKSLVELVILGSVAASVAFLVGTFFKF